MTKHRFTHLKMTFMLTKTGAKQGVITFLGLDLTT